MNLTSDLNTNKRNMKLREDNSDSDERKNREGSPVALGRKYKAARRVSNSVSVTPCSVSLWKTLISEGFSRLATGSVLSHL